MYGARPLSSVFCSVRSRPELGRRILGGRIGERSRCSSTGRPSSCSRASRSPGCVTESRRRGGSLLPPARFPRLHPGIGGDLLPTSGEAVDARTKILETTTRLFATHGYDSTSLSNVAKSGQRQQGADLLALRGPGEPVPGRPVANDRAVHDRHRRLDGLAEAGSSGLIDLTTSSMRNVFSVRFFLSLFLRGEKHLAIG